MSQARRGILAKKLNFAAQNGGSAQRTRIEPIPNVSMYLGAVFLQLQAGVHIFWPRRSGCASESIPLRSVALCAPSEAWHSGREAHGLGALFHGPQIN